MTIGPDGEPWAASTMVKAQGYLPDYYLALFHVDRDDNLHIFNEPDLPHVATIGDAPSPLVGFLPTTCGHNLVGITKEGSPVFIGSPKSTVDYEVVADGNKSVSYIDYANGDQILHLLSDGTTLAYTAVSGPTEYLQSPICCLRHARAASRETVRVDT